MSLVGTRGVAWWRMGFVCSFLRVATTRGYFTRFGTLKCEQSLTYNFLEMSRVHFTNLHCAIGTIIASPYIVYLNGF